MPDPLPAAPETFSVLLPDRLIDPAKRPALTALADFMALTRSITDDAKLQPHLRAAYLTALEGALTTEEGYVPLPKGVPPTIMAPGFTLRRECDARKITVAYGRRIIQAYKQDLTKKGYRDWSELLAYLRFSAASSAQYAVDALGLDKAAFPAAEGLACANALANRMASAGKDLARLKRLYLPQRWLTDAGIDAEDLMPDGAAPVAVGDEAAAWRKVRDQGVAQIRLLLAQAAPGIKAIRPWRLRLAFAWAKADIAARCDAMAASATFPTVPLPKPSALRQIVAAVRAAL
jgi:phytoene/squalene synthetase